MVFSNERSSERLESMYKNKSACIVSKISVLMNNITKPDYDKAESCEEYQEMFVKQYVQMNKLYTYINNNIHSLSKLPENEPFLKISFNKSFDFVNEIAFLRDSERLYSTRQIKIADNLKKKLLSYRKLYKNYVEQQLWVLKGRVNADLILVINSYL
jgi:hypothetical protein